MMKWWVSSLAVVMVGVGCVPTAQWKRENCHYDGAYANGVNEARSGKPMNTHQYVGVCPAELEAEILEGYREGYTVGLQARPLPEDGGSYRRSRSYDADPGPGPSPSYGDDPGTAPYDDTAPPRRSAGSSTDQMPCKYSYDCKPGFCKDRGDGVRLCMNKGERGDYCTNGTECGFGLFCKDGPQGLKVCQ